MLAEGEPELWTMINGSSGQTNNNIIEKYCYNNNPTNCDTFGGLYQWDEMMQYETTQGTQGLCPPNWHIPTDEEWKQLNGFVDSQFAYPDLEWDSTGLCGFDAGDMLKSDYSWDNNGNGNGSDLYGFSALPGGDRLYMGDFFYLGGFSVFWTSTETDNINAWHHSLSNQNSEVYHVNINYYGSKHAGRSLRCIRN